MCMDLLYHMTLLINFYTIVIELPELHFSSLSPSFSLYLLHLSLPIIFFYLLTLSSYYQNNINILWQLPDISDRDRRVMTWLLEDRTGMGGLGDGWEMLVGRELLKVFPVEGNHFSIMKEPDVSPLSITIYTVGLVALTDALLQILGWVDELRTAYWM
jgi:hypothetical protein